MYNYNCLPSQEMQHAQIPIRFLCTAIYYFLEKNYKYWKKKKDFNC